MLYNERSNDPAIGVRRQTQMITGAGGYSR